MPRSSKYRRGTAMFELAVAFALSIAVTTLAVSATSISLRQTRHLNRMAQGLQLAANGLEQSLAMLDQGASIDQVRTAVSERVRLSELPDAEIDIEMSDSGLTVESTPDLSDSDGVAVADTIVADTKVAGAAVLAKRVTVRVRWAGHPAGVWLTGFATDAEARR
ncbi:MAG: hypothetical protein U0795_24215 [Pirellulales bacterium]